MDAKDPDWTVEPTHHGPSGRAYRMAPAVPPDPRAALPNFGSWLLHVPGAHPFWHWWVLTACALRDLPGVPASYRRYPEAEYELLVLALQPDYPPPDPSDSDRDLRYLSPVDVCEHFHEVPGGDGGVRELVELFARAVVDGHLSPDQDHRASWRRYLHGTLSHLRAGLHE